MTQKHVNESPDDPKEMRANELARLWAEKCRKATGSRTNPSQHSKNPERSGENDGKSTHLSFSPL
jgi:hypothetical protein